jgi:uncharacterized membrane-anchored protein YitT (DUF2179 family)
MGLIERIKDKDVFTRYLDFLLGLLIVSVAFNIFFLNHSIVYGVSGIGVMLNYLFGIDASLVIFISSMLLLILSLFLLGKEKTSNSIIGSLLYPLFIKLTSNIIPLVNLEEIETVVVICLGAAITGFGYGLIYRAGFTTGGTDILNQILSKYFKITIGKAMIICDGIIILSSVFVFGWYGVIYSLLTIVIISMISDKVIIGISKSKALYIITEYEDEVKEFFLHHLSHAVTVLDVTGGYSGNKKRMIMCILPTKEYFFAKEAINQIDPNAIFVVTDVYEASYIKD